MPLPARVDTLDAVEEAFRGEYKEGDDGKYYIQVTGVDHMPAVRGLKAKNVELLDEKKALQRELDALGVTADELEELRKKAEEAEKSGDADADKVREEYEAKLAKMREKADSEKQEALAEAEAEREAARNYFLDSITTRAITEHGGEPELLGHVVRSRVKVERADDGRFRHTVLDSDGQPRIKDSSGESLSVSDLVAELKEDDKYGRAFAPSGKNGSGADGGRDGSGSGGANPFKKESRNLTEQMRLSREDPDRARRLAREAGVKLPATG